MASAKKPVCCVVGTRRPVCDGKLYEGRLFVPEQEIRQDGCFKYTTPWGRVSFRVEEFVLPQAVEKKSTEFGTMPAKESVAQPPKLFVSATLESTEDSSLAEVLQTLNMKLWVP